MNASLAFVRQAALNLQEIARRVIKNHRGLIRGWVTSPPLHATPGCDPVLAIGTMKIAAEHSSNHDGAVRPVRVSERIFNQFDSFQARNAVFGKDRETRL